MSTGELEKVLREHAEDVASRPVQDRLAAVDARSAVLRRRRRRGRVAAATLAVVAAVAAALVVPHLAPTKADIPTLPPDQVVEPPPQLAGQQLPATVTVNKVAYVYYRSVESPQGWDTFRVTVTSTRAPQTIVWATPDGTPGRVTVTLDGDVVDRSRAGHLEIGVTVSPRRSHLVVLHLTRKAPDSRMGVAVYRWPQS